VYSNTADSALQANCFAVLFMCFVYHQQAAIIQVSGKSNGNESDVPRVRGLAILRQEPEAAEPTPSSARRGTVPYNDQSTDVSILT
jgi:hypothetical protein